MGRFSVLVLGVCLLLAEASHAASSRIHNACTPSEKWSLEADIPEKSESQIKSFLKRSADSRQSFPEALRLMDEIVFFVRTASHPLERLMPTYAVARLYFTLGYPHLAQRLIERTLIRATSLNAQTGPITTAMVDCLNEIKRQAPTISLDIRLLPVAERAVAFDAANTESYEELQFRLLQEALRAQPTVGGYQLLKSKSAYGRLAQALVAHRNGNQREVAMNLVPFFKLPSRATRRYADLGRLLLARSAASIGKRGAAITILKKVPVQSAEFPSVLSDLGELFAGKDRYQEATDTLINLQLGPMLRTFQPSAHIALSRSLTEVCQYPAAFRMLQSYQSKYNPVLSYLEQVLDEQKEVSLYRRMTDFLASREKPPVFQRTVVLEWVRSLRVVSNQLELNLILKEREMGLEHSAQIRNMPTDQKPGPGAVAFLKSLETFNRGLAPRETELIARIESALRRSAENMVRTLRQNNERAALLEADVLRLAGAQVGEGAVAVAPQTKPKTVSASELNWGRVPASELGSYEVWGDELGSLKTSFANQCAK